MTTMRYKGYEAVVEYDEDVGHFHGEVANLRDIVTFQGISVAELKQAFKESVEDYPAFCRARRGTREAVLRSVRGAHDTGTAPEDQHRCAARRREPQPVDRQEAGTGGGLKDITERGCGALWSGPTGLSVLGALQCQRGRRGWSRFRSRTAVDEQASAPRPFE
jgi:hypothetical protein